MVQKQYFKWSKLQKQAFVIQVCNFKNPTLAHSIKWSTGSLALHLAYRHCKMSPSTQTRDTLMLHSVVTFILELALTQPSQASFFFPAAKVNLKNIMENRYSCCFFFLSECCCLWIWQKLRQWAKNNKSPLLVRRKPPLVKCFGPLIPGHSPGGWPTQFMKPNISLLSCILTPSDIWDWQLHLFTQEPHTVGFIIFSHVHHLTFWFGPWQLSPAC